MLKRKKLIPLNKLHDQIWSLQSKHIRQSNANFQDLCECYTCHVVKHWKLMQVGHYIHSRLDFCKNNLRIQCARCNKWLSGNLGIYGERLIKEIGLEEVEKMRLYSYKKGNDYSRSELMELKKLYESK